MAVAAYASVVSLMHVIENIHYHRHVRQRVQPIMKQVETLEEKVRFLRDFLEAQSPTKMEQIEDLARRIADVAFEADDVIDLHVVDLLRVGESDHDQDMDHLLRSFSRDMENVIEKFDSITEELNEQKDGVQQQKARVSSARPAVSSEGLPPSSGKLTVVGFEERLVQVMEMLMQDQPKLQIVPITGMGGIGKTTLARNVFDKSYIKEKFDRRIWFTLSQEYSVREILLDLLGLKKEESLKTKESPTEAKLGEKLYKSLCGKRYLIVMDDMWSEKAWYDLKSYFPNNGNGSRIIVTTRLSNMTVSLGCRDPYVMDFLSKDASWNLFRQIAFAQDGCSTKLERIGRKIAESCKGLPLAIVVIGGLLANFDSTPQQWKFIADNVYSFGNSEIDEQCLKVLALSYNHLPIHLKPCFLSLGFYPEDHRVRVSELIKMWVAYGFLNPLSCKSLEEVAKEYLKELVDRNLILLERETRTYCVVHDLVRDLCVRESVKEQLRRVPRTQDIIALPNLASAEDVCFLCTKSATKERVHLTELHLGLQTTSPVRMPVCRECRFCYPEVMKLRLVRIKLTNKYSTREIFLHTKLRYITKQTSGDFSSASPAALHLLWNLLTFEMLCSGIPDFAPLGMWEMPQLRHVVLSNRILPDPHVEIVSDDVKLQSRKEFTVLENLHVVKGVHDFRCIKEVVERIPNLKKLKFINRHPDEAADPSCFYSFQNLDHLDKLESLTMFLFFRVRLGNIAFPESLKKLTLFGGAIPWEDMRIVGSLPNLERLKLLTGSFLGPEWNLVEEGQFKRLKSLCMGTIDLVCWNAEKIHFPVLENLQLVWMRSLQEIPSGIGDIDTLRSISISNCCESVIESAKQILEDQHSYGNDGLQLTIYPKRRR